MPHHFVRGAKVRARRLQRRLALIHWRTSGYLLVYFALVLTLPFIFSGPRSWRLGLVRSSGFPIPRAEGELMVLPEYDRRIRNGHFDDFDLVDILDRITDHPRRFLKARHVTLMRLVSEEVTAPIFADPYGRQLRNKTANLFGWLKEDTDTICAYVMETTKDTIATLKGHESWCGLADLVDELPAGHAAGHAPAERAQPQDVRCSTENAHKRERLLLSASNLESKLNPACREIRIVLMEVFPGWLWAGIRGELQERMNTMAADLKFLYGVIGSIYMSDDNLHYHRWLRSSENSGGVGLEVLASRAASDYPGDLDPFTAVLLNLLRDTNFPYSRAFGRYKSPFLKTRQGWLQLRSTWLIRKDLERQARVINTTSDLIVSTILPGVREWSGLIRELEETGVFKKNMKPEPLTWWEKLRQTDLNSEGLRVKAVNDTADHLERLRGYLVQLQHGLPGMMARLDLWEADVAKLDEELTMVLKWGKKYTGRGQQQEEGRSHGRELEITRWEIDPSSLGSIRTELQVLDRALNESWAESESFNPQEADQCNWFESGMPSWSWSMTE